VTPEFPCGIYHYYITDTYPYIQRCVKGSTTGGGGTTTDAGGPQTDGGLPSCTGGQTSMCCGDGVCDGPETTTTCPADCH
jgi:hypothetical protein